ncbi:conserved hypothetical protein [Perkinsus marinus ATCC 50983]|uniref:IMS import disulfide relay-system CHCH-CHCH-like Cx9C domain-containing protein n=1 Tax=Perkinsus marinus (strain ATCC 50983 / TXsc) TaxID=423536 RepID=C5KJF3_PERM5|nr:conserved hypothetical protein [Perkinsus marinus ATCC 50983]EER15455.1 conserved hypothetical protein [Perkinsus marinus ATCC 50983]|eukprot:XP_002783659.1 conserved hypothetical protein [Perkinsus marinus ATCC 50983]
MTAASSVSNNSGVSEAQKCKLIHAEYNACMAKCNGNPSRCTKQEQALRQCGESLGINYCIQEGIDLMQCAKSPTQDGCAKQFIKMRECNRPGGAELTVSQAGGYAMTGGDSAKSRYVRGAERLLGAVPPQRTAAQLSAACEAYAEANGIGEQKNTRF